MGYALAQDVILISICTWSPLIWHGLDVVIAEFGCSSAKHLNYLDTSQGQKYKIIADTIEFVLCIVTMYGPF